MKPTDAPTDPPLGSPDSLQAAIRQTKPFSSLQQEAFLALLLTTDRIRERVFRVFSQQGGVTAQQYNVLRILRGAGPDGLPTLDIAQRMIERTPGITRLIDRLEKKDLVERHRSMKPNADRRQVWCRITGAGLTLLSDLDEPVRLADESSMQGLSDSDLRTLIELLSRLRSAGDLA